MSECANNLLLFTYSVAGLTQDGPWQFHVPAMSSLFVDLPSIRLEGSVRLLRRKADGTEEAVDTDKKIIPCNLLPASIFNQIDVSFNGLMESETIFIQAHNKKLINFTSFFRSAMLVPQSVSIRYCSRRKETPCYTSN